MIEIKSLYKYYGARRAVGPLSASIKQGEVVGLLGLNGSGKTTTLRTLTCDLLPSAGSVSVDGVDVVQEPDRVRAMIGYLPDTPPLYDEMTVRAYTRFVAKLRKVPSASVKSCVEKALESTGLAHVADDAISSLSHGYRQRVGIAQSIVHSPKLVVLDEPSSGLDPVQIREMRQLVRSLGGDHTVLVSSHNLPEISEMCDRVLVIGEGRIIASGTEAELVSRWIDGEQLELTLQHDAPAEQVQEWLAALPGVGSVALRQTSSQPPATTFVVSAEGEIRAELARRVVEKGHGLLHLARSERDLENVFTQLASAAAQSEEAA